MVNALSWEIPPGATDYAYVTYFEGGGPDDPEAKLKKVVEASHHVIVGEIRRGPGFTPEQVYVWAYTKAAPHAAEAVAAHQAAVGTPLEAA